MSQITSNDITSNTSNTIKVNESSIVTPWKVEGKIDYSKLIKDFGTQLIDNKLITRFEKITKTKAHPWLKRGIFFSHRALDEFLTAYENGEPVFLYTGRGPSSNSLHTGHMIPFIFTLYMQQTFNCPLVIQMSDDEKYWFKDIKFEEVYRLGFENAKDIIAFGFDLEKTFIFSNRDYRFFTPEYETFASDVAKFAKQKTIKKIFGFDETATTGMYLWPIYQSIAAFSDAFPHIFNGQPASCMVVYAIDQDPYFRLARDIGSKMNMIKPCSIMSIFLDPLTGSGKMSSSACIESTLFLTDSEKVLRNKIKKYAFSGGGGDGSLEQHKQFGGNPNTDTACKYLKYFEDDDEEYERVCSEFAKGNLTCGDTKKIMSDKLIPIILNHQEKRNAVTDEMVKEFYKKKPMDLTNVHTKELIAEEIFVQQLLKSYQIPYVTSYHKPNFVFDKESSSHVRGEFCKVILYKSNDKFYMFVTLNDVKVNAKAIQKQFCLDSLKFASKEELSATIKCPSLFGVLSVPNDYDITVIIDKKMQSCKYINFYPFRDDALISIAYNDMLKFLSKNNNIPLFYDERT